MLAYRYQFTELVVLQEILKSVDSLPPDKIKEFEVNRGKIQVEEISSNNLTAKKIREQGGVHTQRESNIPKETRIT